MGWKLAHAAHKAALTHLSPRARLALDYMCWTALDAPQKDQAAAEYWGGHLGIAACLLGLEAAPTNTGTMAAKRVIKELIEAGLIEQIRPAAPRRNAVYRLLVGDFWKANQPVDNPDQEALFPASNGVHPRTPLTRNGVHPCTPYGVHPCTPDEDNVRGHQ